MNLRVRDVIIPSQKGGCPVPNPDQLTLCIETFEEISLVLGGASALFENEGQRICQKLDELELNRLKCAMMRIGKALQIAKSDAESVLIHHLLELG